jgi:homoserine kinase type II
MPSTEILETLPCGLCTNGCMLSIKPSLNGNLLVHGNRCLGGVNYAQKILADEHPGHYESAREFLDFSDELIASSLKEWGLNLESILRQSLIPGSPERSLYRVKVQCQEGPFLLELWPQSKQEAKESLAPVLAALATRGLPVAPPLINLYGKTTFKMDDGFWQVVPYLAGIPLRRGEYWQDSWRGQALGQILTELQQSASPKKLPTPQDLPEYILDLTQKAQKHNPLLAPGIAHILQYLDTSLFPFLSSLPLVLSHGDAHPLNVIWGEDQILCLIDWEFCGIRPRIYDLAITMGCVGTEHPQALLGPFNRALLDALKPQLGQQDLILLAPMILALRFAWLGEWLRHGDPASLHKEIQYMNLLLEKQEDLESFANC